ncbi:hypothetical protein FHR21_000616 [Sphingopyxis panaciterrulae]|uniref:Uncharacterized protein n=1 Tax=Sphingopyxis panaciterrulae TaxID=462372 RepID=A0A7W9B3H7_9SPHN|nr:hypothetical protein [Sphingopyxis panaciterrulae]
MTAYAFEHIAAEKKTAQGSPYCTSSKTEGVSALGGPKGLSGLAATTD